MTSVIAELLPGKVAVAELRHDPPDAVLLPAEQESIANAVEKRRREFTTVRHCARLALASLGVQPVPLLRGERGAPTWPDGIVGSMTHCDGYRAAAVAHAADVLSLGIDAEPHGPLPDGVERMVARPEERADLLSLAAERPDVHWDRLLFSAKESVYKTWYPLARRWLGFDDARLVLDRTGGFTAHVLVSGPLSIVTGRWLVHDGVIMTAIALPH